MSESTPPIPKPETAKFHPDQIGPYASREHLDAHVEKELTEIFDLLKKTGHESQKADEIKAIAQEVFAGFDNGIGDQEKLREELSETEKLVILPPLNVQGHDKGHSQRVLLGAIAVCKVVLQEGKLFDPQGQEIEVTDLAAFVENMTTAAICHDVGYFHRQGENVPNGGCFASIHEERSKEFSQEYLQQKGWDPTQIDKITALIGGTKVGTQYDQDFTYPDLREGARLLHLCDMAAYFSAHDIDTVAGNEEVFNLLAGTFREFTYPQINPKRIDRYQTLQGTPDLPDQPGPGNYEWADSKNLFMFGPDPFSFMFNNYGETLYHGEIQPLFNLLDKLPGKNLFREGHLLTLKRQEAVRQLFGFGQTPTIEADKQRATIVDSANFEGMIPPEVWVSAIQDFENNSLGKTDQATLPPPKANPGAYSQFEKRQIISETVRFRTHTSGVNARHPEGNLPNLFERLPTPLIKTKLAELASLRPDNPTEAQKLQATFLETLFKHISLQAFREGVTYLEMRFAPQAYSQDLAPKIGNQALSLKTVLESAVKGVQTAEAIVHDQGQKDFRGQIIKNSQAEISLIPLLRQDVDELNQATLDTLKTFYDQGQIGGLSLGGSFDAFEDAARANQVAEFAESAQAAGLPLEFYLGQEALSSEQVTTSQQNRALQRIAAAATRFVTGEGALALNLADLGKPLIFSPETASLIGSPPETIFKNIQEIKTSHPKLNILFGSGNARVELPTCLVVQAVKGFELSTGQRVEDLFDDEFSPDSVQSGLAKFTDFLRDLTPDYKNPDPRKSGVFRKKPPAS